MATDDELEEIQERGENVEMARDPHANNVEIDAAGRRALYEAGRLAEAQECMDDHNANGCKWTDELRNRVDWLLTDEAVDFWNEQTEDWYQPRKVLKALHDLITGEGQ